MELADMPLYLCDRSGINSFDLQADLTLMKQKYGVEWYLLDYLKLMGGGGGTNDTERLTELSRTITVMTKNMGLCGMIIGSFNKTGLKYKTAADAQDISLPNQAMHDASYVGILTEHIPDDGGKKQDNVITLSMTHIREGDMGLRNIHFLARKVVNGEALPGIYPVELRRV